MGDRLRRLETLVWLGSGVTVTAYLVAAWVARGAVGGQPGAARAMQWALLAVGLGMIARGFVLWRRLSRDAPH